MSKSKADPKNELTVDMANLYREELFTDLKVATIRRLVPIKRNGDADPGRPCIYTGQTHVMTPAGAIPVSCEIDAASIEEAFQKFPDAIEQAIQDVMAELAELRRQASSRLVVPRPGEFGAGVLGGGTPTGGSTPGRGGGIKLP